MSHLFGGGGELGWTALKALLLYVTAIAGFRAGGASDARGDVTL
ncbi:hypothetical protein [Corallococcus sp. EGB]|nr:hypothetical protein [Corallococcus sp. EGB]